MDHENTVDEISAVELKNREKESNKICNGFINGFENAVFSWAKEIVKDKVFMKEFDKSTPNGRKLLDKMLMNEVNDRMNSERHFQPNEK